MINLILTIPGVKEKLIPLIDFDRILTNVAEVDDRNLAMSIRHLAHALVSGANEVFHKKPRMLKSETISWLSNQDINPFKQITYHTHLFDKFAENVHALIWKTRSSQLRGYRNTIVRWNSISLGLRQRIDRNALRALTEIIILAIYGCPMPCPNCRDGRIGTPSRHSMDIYGSYRATGATDGLVHCPMCGYTEDKTTYRDRSKEGIVNEITKNIRIITGENQSNVEEENVEISSINIEL